MIDAIQSLVDKYGKERFLGIGVGVSGIVSYAEGKVVFCPNIGGMDDLPLRRVIAEKTGLPVLADTSARCMALGERHMGAGFLIDDQIFLSLGYGTIAAGIISGGRLYRGADGFAGEIGHSPVAEEPEPERCTCGSRGCLELTATLSMAMIRLERELSDYTGYSVAKNLMNGGPLTPSILAQAYRAGDRLVCARIDKVSRAVGAALADAVNLLNPRLIVVGGGFAEQLPELVSLIEREIKDRCLILARQNLTVKKSTLGTDAPILGGAMLVIDDYLG
jgi:predicted NBD/HSP70 family sugar kinase